MMMLLPLQGAFFVAVPPRALPWADVLLALQAVVLTAIVNTGANIPLALQAVSITSAITSEATLNHAKVSEANKNENTATASKDDDSFALAGRIFILPCPQGVALGWHLIGLSGRSITSEATLRPSHTPTPK